jgi:ribosomal protein S24E
MEIEMLEKKDQPLFSRVEITFKVTHPKERTPKRDVVREELATQLNVKKNSVIIDNMKAVFGKTETIGFAKIYKSETEAKAYEREHILVRNKLKSGKVAAGKEKKEEKTEEPKKEVKEEVKEEPKEKAKEEKKEEAKKEKKEGTE